MSNVSHFGIKNYDDSHIKRLAAQLVQANIEGRDNSDIKESLYQAYYKMLYRDTPDCPTIKAVAKNTADLFSRIQISNYDYHGVIRTAISLSFKEKPRVKP